MPADGHAEQGGTGHHGGLPGERLHRRDGFALLGHSYEMAQGSGCTIHLRAQDIPYHGEAYEMAEMGFIPAGAYRNRTTPRRGSRLWET